MLSVLGVVGAVLAFVCFPIPGMLIADDHPYPEPVPKHPVTGA